MFLSPLYLCKMKFRVGDRVSVLDSTLEGKVIAIEGSEFVTVHTNEGFEESFDVSELLQINEEGIDVREVLNPDSFSEILLEKESPEKPKKSKPHVDRFGRVDMEVDLHIESLIDRFRHLSNTEILNIQLTALRNAIDKAFAMDYHRLIVIHGVGQGILRKEVESVLSEYNGLEYFDASYKEYGLGATEVRIH